MEIENSIQSLYTQPSNEQLVKITVDENRQQLVNGRELHEVLKVEKAFSTWIQTQLESIDAIEGEDFIPLKEESTGGRPSVDYILTLDIAKEICMVVGVAPRTNAETKALSKKVRKYFIECEKQLKSQKSLLTDEQKIILQLYDGGITAVEAGRLLGQMEYQKGKQQGEIIGYEKGEDSGMSKICKNGTITQKQIMEMIKQKYPTE